MTVVILKAGQKIEIPPEVPNGITTDFTTIYPFTPGTVSVWYNGILLRADLETGFSEVPPTTIRFNEAPIEGDTVMIRYEIL